jgi:hypothetical protein
LLLFDYSTSPQASSYRINYLEHHPIPLRTAISGGERLDLSPSARASASADALARSAATEALRVTG